MARGDGIRSEVIDSGNNRVDIELLPAGITALNHVYETEDLADFAGVVKEEVRRACERACGFIAIATRTDKLSMSCETCRPRCFATVAKAVTLAVQDAYLADELTAELGPDSDVKIPSPLSTKDFMRTQDSASPLRQLSYTGILNEAVAAAEIARYPRYSVDLHASPDYL